MKLIDKAAIVAEIERRIKETESMQPKFDQFWAGQISAFKGVLKILDTFEVKEVDLEKEIKKEYLNRRYYGGRNNMLVILNELQFNKIAKHFFELGLKIK